MGILVFRFFVVHRKVFQIIIIMCDCAASVSVEYGSPENKFYFIQMNFLICCYNECNEIFDPFVKAI